MSSRSDACLTELRTFGLCFFIIPGLVLLLVQSGSGDSIVVLLFLSSFVLLASLLALSRDCFTFDEKDGLNKLDDKRSHHYLAFLKICRNLFTLLTLCWILFGTAAWDMEINYASFFLPLPIFRVAVTHSFTTMRVALKGVHKIISLTLAEGCIAFLFIGKFEKLERSLRQETSLLRHEKIHRTLWLSGIPVEDRATKQTYQLPVRDFGKHGVEGDLKKAIRAHLEEHRREHDVYESGRRKCLAKLSRVWLCNFFCGYFLPLEKQELIRKPIGKQDLETPANGLGEGLQSTGADHEAAHIRESKQVQEKTPLSVTVQPVMKPYLQLIRMYNEILDAHETSSAYNQLREACGSSRIWRLNRCYYQRKQERANQRKRKLEDEFEHVRVNELRMSGHAFVTFDDKLTGADDRAKLVEEHDWWELFDHSKFKFGRAPFSSVTLECRQAPHPSDIQWDNLRSKMVCLPVILLVLALVLFIVVAIFHLALASQLDERGLCLRSEKWAQTDTWWLSSLDALCDVADKLKAHEIGYASIRQLPTIMLLFLNVCVVPFWIQCVLKKIGFYLHSRQELFELRLNFFALLLSKFLVPLVSITVVYVGLELGHGADFGIGTIGIVLGPCQNVIGRYGFFVLQYIINCAFFGNIWSILQLTRHFVSMMRRKRAVTPSQVRLAMRRQAFSYGYWYAWSLSVAAIGLILSSIVPSLLPVTALFFWIKHSVDHYLFQRKAFDPRPETSGMYAPQVVHFLSCIVSVKMIGTGAIMLLMQWVDEVPACFGGERAGSNGGELPQSNGIIKNDNATFVGALLLVVLASVLWLLSCYGYLVKMLEAASPSDLKRRTWFARFTNGLVRTFNRGFVIEAGTSYDFTYTKDQHRDARSLYNYLRRKPGLKDIPESCLSPGACLHMYDGNGQDLHRLLKVSNIPEEHFPINVSISQEALPEHNVFCMLEQQRQDENLSAPLLEQDRWHWDAREHLQRLNKRQLDPRDLDDVPGYEQLRYTLDDLLKEKFRGPKELDDPESSRRVLTRRYSLPCDSRVGSEEFHNTTFRARSNTLPSVCSSGSEQQRGSHGSVDWSSRSPLQEVPEQTLLVGDADRQ